MEIEENVAAAHLVVRLDFVLWPVNMIGKLIFWLRKCIVMLCYEATV